MRKVALQIAPWDKYYYAEDADGRVKVGQQIVFSGDFGQDIAKAVEIIEGEMKEGDEVVNIDRLANVTDLELAKNNNQQHVKTLRECKDMIAKNDLDMKLIDCHFSLDDRRINFAFIADGRVDFRNLVKELTRHFSRAVRLYQLGVRDEAKLTGDVGCCGLNLCCRTHLKKIGSVTSDMAEQQQVAHRGSERLSGICGRLKCCLAYEKDLYDDLAKNLPPVGTRVSTQFGRGEIISWHTLRSSVSVRLDPEKQGDRSTIVEIPITKK
ncbi:MAG: regulatory iron-sulfur-containing complex subunit RicT [bacterium]